MGHCPITDKFPSHVFNEMCIEAGGRKQTKITVFEKRSSRKGVFVLVRKRETNECVVSFVADQ